MNDSTFDAFNLAGGTSLALQIGHRQSIDIDLFGSAEIDEPSILSTLGTFGETILLKRTPNILICTVAGVKLDLVNYSYPLIHPPAIEDGIRLLTQPDIGAMKLNAIAGRGSRKDFIDLYFLLKTHSIEELLTFYKAKYNDGSEFMILKSLTYFDDADSDIQPLMFEDVDWNTVKDFIRECV